MHHLDRIRLLVASCIALCIACSAGPDLAGTSTSSGNARTVAIAGRALYEDGTPASGAQVRLRPKDYLADTVAVPMAPNTDRTTDDLGYFTLDSVNHGTYSLEVNDGRGFAALVGVGADTLADSAVTAHVTLVPSCTLAGVVRYDGGVSSAALVRIAGLERLVYSEASSGSFSLTGLPEGALRVVITPLLARYSSVTRNVNLSRSDRQELPAVTLSAFDSEDYGLWTHAESLFVDGSLSRGTPGEKLESFPLLVRLDTSALRFELAAEGGRDLRFSRNGRHLQFEIEHWDSANSRASVWILIDTLLCDDTAQAVIMHWGKADAQEFSTPAAVFAAQHGFTGVWHLGQTVATVDGGSRIVDATGRYDGVDVRTSLSEGIAGRARAFDRRVGSHIDLGTNLPAFVGAQGITLESWVHTTGSGYDQNVLSFTLPVAGGQESYRADLRVSGTHNAAQAIFNPGDSALYASVSQSSTDTLAKGHWYYVAACADFPRDSMYLYVNGARVAARGYSFTHAQVSAAPVASADIGARVNGSKNYFSGTLDESRAHHVSRSPAWIAMTYESTRPGSRAVRFGR